jgi:hypothetical protein
MAASFTFAFSGDDIDGDDANDGEEMEIDSGSQARDTTIQPQTDLIAPQQHSLPDLVRIDEPSVMIGVILDFLVEQTCCHCSHWISVQSCLFSMEKEGIEVN